MYISKISGSTSHSGWFFIELGRQENWVKSLRQWPNVKWEPHNLTIVANCRLLRPILVLHRYLVQFSKRDKPKISKQWRWKLWLEFSHSYKRGAFWSYLVHFVYWLSVWMRTFDILLFSSVFGWKNRNKNGGIIPGLGLNFISLVKLILAPKVRWKWRSMNLQNQRK